jgi:hypothetical protein
MGDIVVARILLVIILPLMIITADCYQVRQSAARFWWARSGAICEIAASSPSGFAAQFIAVRRSGASVLKLLRRHSSLSQRRQVVAADQATCRGAK